MAAITTIHTFGGTGFTGFTELGGGVLCGERPWDSGSTRELSPIPHGRRENITILLTNIWFVMLIFAFNNAGSLFWAGGDGLITPPVSSNTLMIYLRRRRRD